MGAMPLPPNLAVLTAAACCLLATRPVMASTPVVLTDATQEYPLGLSLELLEDRESRWTFKDVTSAPIADRFSKSRDVLPNFGFTTSAYWVRLELRNESSSSKKWNLVYGYSHIEQLDVYFVDSAGHPKEIHLGQHLPFDQREVEHRYFIIPLSIERGEQRTITLRLVAETSMFIPLSMLSPEALARRNYHEQLFNGLSYGGLLLIVAYNLVLFFWLRDKSYLHLVLYMIGMGMFGFNDEGYSFQYLWPNLPHWNTVCYVLSLAFSEFFSLAYTRSFLSTRSNTPRLDRMIRVLMGATLLSMTAPLFARTALALVPAVALLFFAVAVSFAAGVVCWRQGYRPARLYLLAWTSLMIAAALTALFALGVLTHPFFNEVALKVGVGLQLVLHSLALADRFNLIKEEKEQAQARALEVQRQAAEQLEEEVSKKTQALRERTREVETAYERLAEHDRLKSSFFSNVSHELRTPLTLIITPLSRMLQSGDRLSLSAVRERMRSMMGNAQRLLRLVNQLLDFAKLESGAASVSYEPLEVRSLVEPIVEGFTPFARSKGLKLELRGPDKLPSVYWDPNNLDKVLTNLLSNACKFTEPGGNVVIRLESDEKVLTISVKDTGVGIDRAQLPKIFERFHRVEDGTTRKYEGTGIGLALCRELVDLTGGELLVESEHGLGSTFSLVLPLGQDHIQDPSKIRDPSDERQRTPSTVVAAVGALDSTAGNKTSDLAEQPIVPARPVEEESKPSLLVVEDNPDMRSLVAEICGEEFRVLQASDGQQALEILEDHTPSLVISDVMMPGIDGYELLRRVRANPSTAGIPMMLLTARVGPEMRLEGLEFGADDYLTKPFEPRELMARARNLVRLKEQERQLQQLNARLQEEVVKQAAELERARMLGRYLSPEVLKTVMEQGVPVQVSQKRARLTIFRLELRGFRRLIETTEPEDMVAMLNGYLSAMMQVAFENGATVDRFVQDTVTGFFGAPTSEGHEQDAVRCSRMAVEMWQRAWDVCTRWREHLSDVTLAPTMVLASGYATVGNFGSSSRMEYTAVGGPVNEAVILLRAVQPGTVACSQSTWSLIKNEIDGQFSSSVEVSYRSRPVELYQIASAPSGTAKEPLALSQTLPPDSEELRVTAPVSPVETGDLEVGTVLGGRYECTRRLGKGGMGIVYLVRDLKLEIAVALKLIRHVLRSDQACLKRLYREVKLARLVSHPNVARIFDLGDWRGFEFITMEYIDGQSLDHCLETGGAMDVAEGCRVFQQICAGLSAAHVAGVVHRDLKPSNIMMERGGRVVILDFGIAKGISSIRHTQTETKGIFGTPRYMAPEQFDDSPVDQRSDIYALGLLGYEIFSGRVPFDSDNAVALAYKHVHEPPPSLATLQPGLPPRLAAVIMRCLDKSPRDRFGSVGEIMTLLKDVWSA